MRGRAWLALLLPGLVAPALAADPVGLRMAVHPGFSRLVFDFQQPATATVRHDGNHVVISFPGSPHFVAGPGTDLARLPHLRDATITDGSISLTLPDGVALHSFSLGNRRIFDFKAASDPAGPAPAHHARPLPPPATLPPAIVAEPAPAPAMLGDLSPATIAAEPVVEQVARASDPAPERTPRAALDVPADDPDGPLVLAFAASTGATAFRRGDSEIVVFDEPRTIDPTSLRSHPGYAQADVEQLGNAVELRVPLPPGRVLALSHDGTDWSLTPADAAPLRLPITATADAGRLHLATQAPDQPGQGHAITIADPLTGDTLLVGTVPGGGVALADTRRTPAFTVLPTDLGVAIVPLSDHVTLHPEAAGYVVESDRADTPLALTRNTGDPSLSLSAAGLTRSFDLPNDPPAALLRRLHGRIADASVVPLRDRLPYRRGVAETMLALGMGAEAQGVLQLAATDDPRALSDPATQDIAAAAALIAGRLDETAALAGPPPAGSPDTSERQLWRALRDAARLTDDAAPDPATVTALQAGLPLLVSYPPSLRRALLPLAADTLLRGNALPGAARLLAQFPDDPGLALARAVAADKNGQPDAALAAYDRLTQGRDRSVRARAAMLAVELRLSRHLLTTAQAADAADRLIYAWRGDARELNLRLRVAALHHQGGSYRQELQALRDAADAFPEQAADIKPRLAAAFAGIVSPSGGMAQLPPLETVSLIQENADLLPDGPAGEAMSGMLADRLAALDLPHQAADVLAKLVQATQSASARAAFGTRLAALQLAQQQPQPALDALAQSDAAGLSPELAEQRALLAARAHAALGDQPAALATLAPLTDAPALLARATVQEDAHDWPHAAATLAVVLAQTGPATGPLDPTQSGLVLRLAGATAQAGDETALAKLRQDYATRLPDPNDAALLALLTEPPIRATTDLPRAAAETTAARAVPRELQAMQ